MEGSSLNAARTMLGWVDTSMFVVMLIISALIGIYFAYCDPKRTATTSEYLVGSRSMGTAPIALSLIASFVSGITILGNPAETYVYGCQYFLYPLILPIWGLIFSSQIMPVIRGLSGMSLYEYFSVRFNKRVRVITSFLFLISLLTWLPIVVYTPAMAFEQVAGIDLHLVAPIVCLVCIYYTTVGGIKAVVWTDSLQAVIMIGCVITVIVKGIISVGGMGVVWERNVATTRFEPPSFSIDPTTRITVFTATFGGLSLFMMSCGLQQMMVQRYIALPNMRETRKALWYFVLGVSFFLGSCGFVGHIIYAKHYDCDPVSLKIAKRYDQLLPLFVMETLGDVPGLAGLFIAGVFSAALSSLSTGLNSIAGVILEDWVMSYWGKQPSERQAGWILKGVVVLLGIVVTALVFVVEQLGMVLQLSVSLSAISYGPLLALFMTGMFLPWANTKAAILGASVGGCASAVVIFGAQYGTAVGRFHVPKKAFSTTGCVARYNITTEELAEILFTNVTTLVDEGSEVPALFRMSFMWYTPLALSVALVVTGLAVLAGWRNDLRHVDPKLLAPLARKWLPSDNVYLSAPTDEKEMLKAVPLQVVTGDSEKPSNGTTIAKV